MSSLVIGDIQKESPQEIPEISKNEQKASFGGLSASQVEAIPFDSRRVQLH